MSVTDDERPGVAGLGANGWSTIAATLKEAIGAGEFSRGSRIPSERALSLRFGVSRMTTRRALAELEAEGLLRIAHGSGVFVTADTPVRFRLGERVRFGKDLLAPTANLTRKVLSAREVPASGEMASRLALQLGDLLLEMRVVAYSDDLPVSVVTRSCSALRFPRLAEKFGVSGSFTAVLREFGIADYRRRSTDITARMPAAWEARALQQSTRTPVLAYAGEDMDAEGNVISSQIGCFASEKVIVTV